MNRRRLFKALIGSAAVAAAEAKPKAATLTKWAICYCRDGVEPTLGNIMLSDAGQPLLFDRKLEAQSYSLRFLWPALTSCIRRFEFTSEGLRQAWRPTVESEIVGREAIEVEPVNGTRCYQPGKLALKIRLDDTEFKRMLAVANRHLEQFGPLTGRGRGQSLPL